MAFNLVGKREREREREKERKSIGKQRNDR